MRAVLSTTRRVIGSDRSSVDCCQSSTSKDRMFFRGPSVARVPAGRAARTGPRAEYGLSPRGDQPKFADTMRAGARTDDDVARLMEFHR